MLSLQPAGEALTAPEGGDATESSRESLLRAALGAAISAAAGSGDAPEGVAARHAELVARRMRESGALDAPRITARLTGQGVTETPGLEYVEFGFENESTAPAVGLSVGEVSARAPDSN